MSEIEATSVLQYPEVFHVVDLVQCSGLIETKQLRPLNY